MKYFPILVPVKQRSSRCPNKNEHLLPYLYNCFYKIQRNSQDVCEEAQTLLDQVVILCDSDSMVTAARMVGFKNVWLEPQYKKNIKLPSGEVKEITASICKTEYESMWQWKLSYDKMSEEERNKMYPVEFNTDWMFLAPATQPIKHYKFYKSIYLTSGFFESRIKKGDTHIDLIVSAQTRPIRRLFDINIEPNDYRNEFNPWVKNMSFDISDKKVHTRKGSDCTHTMSVDGTWYFFRANILSNMQDEDSDTQNNCFWHSRKMCISCEEQPFIDIDETYDLKKLEFLKEMLK